jgi:hypothetical protein
VFLRFFKLSSQSGQANFLLGQAFTEVLGVSLLQCEALSQLVKLIFEVIQPLSELLSDLLDLSLTLLFYVKYLALLCLLH